MDVVEEKLIYSFQQLAPEYSGEPLLIAVSGGVDSMVAASVFKKYKYPVTVIHCNFQLRKKDSDDDALLVKKWATKNKVPHISKKFTVKKIKGDSLQMTARNLRYEWFQQVAAEKKFQYIITAHHLNDSIETSLMNIIRGTGINGLTGIPSRNGNVLRPMLDISREEIEEYATRNKIEWRLDKSNLTTKYKRNSIRHQLIPILLNYNPNFIETYSNNIHNWQNAARIYKQAIARLKTELVHFDEALMAFKISALELAARGINNEILFELLHDFGFNSDQSSQIADALHNHPGKKFFSHDHILLVDRLFILIKPVEENETLPDVYTVPYNLPQTNELWEITEIPANLTGSVHINMNEILLGSEHLIWPLTIRKWAAGDKFIPMGMKGKKKISDFLTDLKLDRFKKEDVWVVECGDGKIAGVIGYRPDEKFKISKNTQLCIKVRRRNLYF